MRNGQVVMVTGASAGVGRATVRLLAGRGARLGLMARDPGRLEQARREVEDAGSEALVLPADVADAAAVEDAAARLERRFGPLDVWINNAMVSVFSPVMETTAEEYRRVTEVTYLGYVHGTQAALRRMLPRDRGVIVQVGSALAYRGIPLQSAYCAAKHAIEGFSDSLRCELHHDRSRVRVAMVQLPAVNTPQFRWVRSRLPHKAQPVPPVYQPEVAARAVVAAAAGACREVWLGRNTVLAILGNMLAPGLLDRWLGHTGYAAQQGPEPEDPRRPDNLHAPVPGEQGARGAFEACSRASAVRLPAALVRAGAVFACAAVLGAALAWRRSARS